MQNWIEHWPNAYCLQYTSTYAHISHTYCTYEHARHTLYYTILKHITCIHHYAYKHPDSKSMNCSILIVSWWWVFWLVSITSELCTMRIAFRDYYCMNVFWNKQLQTNKHHNHAQLGLQSLCTCLDCRGHGWLHNRRRLLASRHALVMHLLCTWQVLATQSCKINKLVI